MSPRLREYCTFLSRSDLHLHDMAILLLFLSLISYCSGAGRSGQGEYSNIQ